MAKTPKRTKRTVPTTIEIDISEHLAPLFMHIIQVQMQVTTLRLALEDEGILTASVKDKAMKRAQQIWEPVLKTIEEALAASDPIRLQRLEQLLKDFKGPLQ
jgi:hypothetical protein